MPTLTDDTTNRGEELMPRRLPTSSRSRRLRHTISALMIVVALPAAITTSQAAASAMPLTASSDAAASVRGDCITITTAGGTTIRVCPQSVE